MIMVQCSLKNPDGVPPGESAYMVSQYKLTHWQTTNFDLGNLRLVSHDKKNTKYIVLGIIQKQIACSLLKWIKNMMLATKIFRKIDIFYHICKICMLTRRQKWPRKRRARTTFRPINNTSKTTGSCFCTNFEGNMPSFYLVYTTMIKRISYSYHGNAWWLSAAKLQALLGHYYSDVYTICTVRPSPHD